MKKTKISQHGPFKSVSYAFVGLKLYKNLVANFYFYLIYVTFWKSVYCTPHALLYLVQGQIFPRVLLVVKIFRGNLWCLFAIILLAVSFIG
jgi:hypothetical protein